MPPPATRAIAFLVADDGVEERELVHPWQAVRTAGFDAALLAPDTGGLLTHRHDVAEFTALLLDALSRTA